MVNFTDFQLGKRLVFKPGARTLNFINICVHTPPRPRAGYTFVSRILGVQTYVGETSGKRYRRFLVIDPIDGSEMTPDKIRAWKADNSISLVSNIDAYRRHQVVRYPTLAEPQTMPCYYHWHNGKPLQELVLKVI